MKNIIWKKPNGELAITTIVNPDIDEKEESQKLMLDQNHIGYEVIGYNVNIPKEMHSRDFRKSWDLVDGALVVNLAKAEEEKIAEIRTKRNNALSSLDISYMKALEKNDTSLMQKIALQKQALRDLPSNLDLSSIKSVSDLKSLNPKEIE